ncbi:MAG TPA: NAD-glutamate dehydrogenase [Streptosporangiaceae bacterium]|jgi:glutamate dehydrogenase|nr:NAD-glutamate dehydrogenase [Streptosporangiaceae bacterium]
MSEHQSAARQALLSDATAQLGDGAAPAKVGDCDSYLHCYYRHVDSSDLIAAGPRRVGAVAAAHAQLAALRPQGRAAVRVRPGADATLLPDRDVIDVVTDDMPFLVDTLTMTLAAHEVAPDLVVHPQLMVRRDVTGALREVIKPTENRPGDQPPDTVGDPDVITESWSHIEVAKLAPGKATAIAADLEHALWDVRLAVDDYPKMRAMALRIADELAATGAIERQLAGEGRSDEHGLPAAGSSTGGGPKSGGWVIPSSAAESPSEIELLLRWLVDSHFTFLGFREYDLVSESDGLALHGVPGTGLGILRHDKSHTTRLSTLSAQARKIATDPRQRLIMTKANSRATVHRSSYLDYVGIKRLDESGKVIGEWRFLGLYTHMAYTDSITRIPILRRKLNEVYEASGIAADSHDGRAVAEFMEVYPREELFQVPVAELAEVASEVLRLRERMQTRLFVRRDIYGRYVSCLIYLSRDRYNTKVRVAVQEILRRVLGGAQVDYSAVVDEGPIARLHVVVRAERGKTLVDPDVPALEQAIAAAVRSWDDDLVREAVAQLGEREGRDLLAEFSDAISDTYKADVPAAAAISDLAKIRQMRNAGLDISFEMWESAGYVGGIPVEHDLAARGVPAPAGGSEIPGGQRRVWRLTIHRTGSPITLTDVLPRLQHMGVEVVDEHPYEFPGRAPFWIYDFGLRRQAAAASGPGGRTTQVPHVSLASVAGQLEGALAALWKGEIEDDDFNTLVLDAGLTWRQVVVLRAYAKYLQQAGTTFSSGYIARVLRSNPVIARQLVRLFESRFDPDRSAGQSERSEALFEEVGGALDDVASLDEDRILRAYLGLIIATERTNYFREVSDTDDSAPYLVFKLNAALVPDLPAPRPKFELFVYSPRFEGVHLRFANVARGGLRWSDRREDFRTEILGLAKAQEVKNSVIVPSGAKGGFVCKQLPDPSDRDAYQGEVRDCYRSFISAMLDVTDNLRAGQVVPPDRVVRHDGDDPYLVVAADKGTATFSDTANEIALRRGFWLGDAFASGGSAGYDHKKMGITARGAWESVKFHFQTLGTDISKTDFTVIGIGDMSGDVFGNGMLLSEHIKLVAAFDHRHLFLDPDPDPAASFAERQRLFDLPRSSWADYNTGLISSGGGVWPRSAKSVPVSPQVRAVLGLEDGITALSPDQLITAVLAAPVDLLWNGGIGTYVRASNQSNADVGDRSNDAVRIEAPQLRAKVVGEGGNLGLTQEARIEYSLAGGLVNTDFIDNSAGVDTSDHEVNIKILLDQVVRDGEMTTAERDALLQSMTDEVARLVLADNYHQNRALAAARAQSAQMLHVHARYIRKLEREGRIKRRLDVLPADKDIAERRSTGSGLTLPEFSVLLAHTKIATGQEVLGSDVPDDPYLARALTRYFPIPLRERFASLMPSHRLHREIITTAVINEMVDKSGITFTFRLNEETGASVPHITEAFLIARDVFDMPGFWLQLRALDGLVDTSAQVLALLEARKLTERAARWLLHFRRPPFDIQRTIDFFAGGVLTVAGGLPKLLAGLDLSSFEERRDMFTSRGFPDELAERVAGMVPAYSAFDIVDIAASTGRPVEETAEVYFDLADRLQITRLRDRITALARDDRWNTMARNALRDDLYTAHAALTRDVLTVTESGTPEQRLAAWVARNQAAVARASQTLVEIWESDAFTVATLSVAVRAIRTLVASSTLPD